jgi:hypothetical protein
MVRTTETAPESDGLLDAEHRFIEHGCADGVRATSKAAREQQHSHEQQ